MTDTTVREDVLAAQKEMERGIRAGTWTPVTEAEVQHDAITMLECLGETAGFSLSIACGRGSSNLVALLVERDWWREQALRAKGLWPSSEFFYEEDEPVEEVEAAFERSTKHLTAPPKEGLGL